MSDDNPQQESQPAVETPQIVGVKVNRRAVMVKSELVEMPEKDQPKDPFPVEQQ